MLRSPIIIKLLASCLYFWLEIQHRKSYGYDKYMLALKLAVKNLKIETSDT